MASTNRTGRSGSGRSASKNTKGKTSSKKQAVYEEETLDNKLLQEIALIIVFAICVFLFLCNFGIVGSFGDVLSNIQFGLFGFPAYVTPVLFFLALAFGTINQGSYAARRKLVSGIVLYILAGMVCELVAEAGKAAEEYNIVSLYQGAAERHVGGGVIAGSLAWICYHYLSLVGTILLILVLGLICIVLLTEKSVIKGARRGGRFLAEGARELEMVRHSEDDEEEEERESWAQRRERLQAEKEERIRLRREEQEERERYKQEQLEERARKKRIQREEKEDEKILRMNKKSRGVMMDTSLIASQVEQEASEKVRDDIHEITVQDMEAEVEYTEENDGQFRFEEEKPAEEADYYGDGISEMPEPVTEFSPRKTVSAPHSIQTGEVTPEGGVRRNREEAFPQENIPGERNLKQQAPAGQTVRRPAAKYVFPPISLLKKGSAGRGDSSRELKDTARRLQQTLETFGVKVAVTDISQGPAVTRFELQPEQGVKVSKIVGLADDIKLNLAATDIRIEAPIPGKAAVGIEVPNKENSTVAFRDLLESDEYKNFPSKIAFAVGKDIGGQVVVTDIAKMPHMLIAGATGSGKSVCINTIIMSILYKAHPDEVKLIMIDPKVVELSVYNGIPHLLLPVVTDPKKAASALHWGVAEMTERYNKFAETGVRDLKGYNQKIEQQLKQGDDDSLRKMPQIVIIVDELADLMMVAPGEVEESICRLAQLARAAGIHLVIATQRPSVDVITGLIKANMPSRVAFAVSSGVDSRTILDMNGAEKLLGKGDMLFYPQGYPKPARVQGAFISDGEVQAVADFLKEQSVVSSYHPDIEKELQSAASSGGSSAVDGGSGVDEYFAEAGRFIIEKEKASIGMLQRVFKIGFNRAARIMDQLCDAGVVGEEEGTKPRKVLMSKEEFEQYIEEVL